jgi:hypothetical protein
MRFFIPCFLIAFACSCAPTSQSGDFGAFIVQQVARYGGHTRGTNTVSPLEARWTLNADLAGFQLHVTGVQFSNVQSVLQQAFGSPAFVITNDQGQPHGLYKGVDIGVAMQFFGEPSGVGIVCVRGAK